MKRLRTYTALRSIIPVASLVAVTGLASSAKAQPTADLIISEYVEGLSNNKAFEIYNGTGATIDLAAGGYFVEMYFNATATPNTSVTINLTGSLPAGCNMVLAHPSALVSAGGVVPDAVVDFTPAGNPGWFNGNDSIVLRKTGNVVVDSLGQIASNPATEWGTGLTSTADNTLRRKATVTAGDTDPNNGPFDPAVEWDGFATNTVDDLGTYAGSSCGPTGGGGTPVPHTIQEIQGSTVTVGAASPLVGTAVIVTGCTVTADFQTASTSTGMNGFFCQAASDGNVNTSDGIFVLSATAVNVGDVVNVTGNVLERESGTIVSPAPGVGGQAGTETAITATAVTVTGTAALPASTPVAFPIDNDQLEKFEGMLVNITTGATGNGMLVTQNFFLGRYGQLTLASPATASSTLTRLVTPTQQSNDVPTDTSIWTENQRRLLILDDGMDLSGTGDNPNPTPFNNDAIPRPTTPPSTGPFLYARAGSTVTNLTGILDWGQISSGGGISDYRLQATTAAGRTGLGVASGNPSSSGPNFLAPVQRPTAPTTPGGLIVADANVLNYFTDFQDDNPSADYRGAFTAAEFKRQTDKIVQNICALNADIVGLSEVQNIHAVTAHSQDRDWALKTLVGSGSVAQRTFDGIVVDGLNQVCGPYTAILSGVDDDTNNTDAIKNAIIYKSSRVTPVATSLSGCQAATGGGQYCLIKDTTVPQRSRPTIVQKFSLVGSAATQITIGVNHLKSKGSSCGGTVGFSGNCNTERTTMATLVRNSLNSAPGDVLLLGDFNAYAKEDPVLVFTQPLSGSPWSDTITNALGLQAQDFIFDGMFGTLTYAMANSSLASKVVAAQNFRSNSDEEAIREYGTPPWYIPAAAYQPDAYRAADHDPIRVVLNLGGPKVPFLPPAGVAGTGLGILSLGALVAMRRRRAR